MSDRQGVMEGCLGVFEGRKSGCVASGDSWRHCRMEEEPFSRFYRRFESFFASSGLACFFQ